MKAKVLLEEIKKEEKHAVPIKSIKFESKPLIEGSFVEKELYQEVAELRKSLKKFRRSLEFLKK